MQELINKHIVLGVSGGIAAYKSAELVRRLRDAGADVRVVMTPAATHFVTPLTFQALSGHTVHVDLLDMATENAMGHIELARWAEAVVVAPASADFMARHAQGLANDLLTALCLGARTPLLLAPAMNQAMWRHPATQANVMVLRQRGVSLVGPVEGEQACGDTGPGRMAEPAEIVAALGRLFVGGALAGTRVLITAGPTHEAIDAVRYITNRSSGRMGYALAQAAAEAGAHVTMVSGPVHISAPTGVQLIGVENAAAMYSAVMERMDETDIFIAAAAVADYTISTPVAGKLKKTAAHLTLELQPTSDILATVTAMTRRPYTVGFAAETEHLERAASAKLLAKNVDMIAGNLVGQGQGFDVDENALVVLWRDGRMELQRARKTVLARQLIDLIAERYYASDATQDT